MGRTTLGIELTPLTSEGCIAREGEHVVQQEIERHPDACFPLKVQQHLGVERHTPAATFKRPV